MFNNHHNNHQIWIYYSIDHTTHSWVSIISLWILATTFPHVTTIQEQYLIVIPNPNIYHCPPPSLYLTFRCVTRPTSEDRQILTRNSHLDYIAMQCNYCPIVLMLITWSSSKVILVVGERAFLSFILLSSSINPNRHSSLIPFLRILINILFSWACVWLNKRDHGPRPLHCPIKTITLIQEKTAMTVFV